MDEPLKLNFEIEVSFSEKILLKRKIIPSKLPKKAIKDDPKIYSYRFKVKIKKFSIPVCEFKNNFQGLLKS